MKKRVIRRGFVILLSLFIASASGVDVFAEDIGKVVYTATATDVDAGGEHAKSELRFIFTGECPVGFEGAFVTCVTYEMDTGIQGMFQFAGVDDCVYTAQSGIEPGIYNVSVSAPPGYEATVLGADRIEVGGEGEPLCVTVEIQVSKQYASIFYAVAF